VKPTLNALAFLHDRKLVQGRLKPSNILVVGDEVKLASDTIRPVGEDNDSIKACQRMSLQRRGMGGILQPVTCGHSGHPFGSARPPPADGLARRRAWRRVAA